ncbi:host attachment protein [Microvirga makkahensis]|uniref:host attachment protein n=1 Tax=Microvirga makkahensis TaxID=1128670 RepID=UPI001FED106D|nr:host attachment protein [Microvirga makkahensis]
MSQNLKPPYDGLVFLSDGRKAFLLKNEEDDVFSNLQVERVIQAEENPPTRQQGADKPGFAASGIPPHGPSGTGRPSATSPQKSLMRSISPGPLRP